MCTFTHIVPPEEQLEELKWRAWDQAWEQSRHLETMRSQYLGFFFTVALGASVFGGKQIADDALGTPGSMVLLCALALGLEFLAGVLLLGVMRIGEVLGHYLGVIVAIQSEVAAGTSPPWLKLPPRREGWRSTHRAAQIAFGAALAAMPFAILAALIRSVTVDGVPTATVVVCAGSFIVGVALSAFAGQMLRDERARA